MILSVLSDIHGNLEAFSEVLKEIKTINPHKIISLGDNIGYGPNSEEVMNLISKHRIESVLGNHEMVVKDYQLIRWFNPVAQKAVKHTLEHLSKSSIKTIKAYEKFIVRDDLRFVHGVPPCSVFLYIFQLQDSNIMKRLDNMEQRICFIGHTHDLGIIEYDGSKLERRSLNRRKKVQLRKNCRYIINAGSVGQPRDGDTSAKFMVFDTEKDTIEVKYVPYDFTLTMKKIIEAGLPSVYAEKLSRRFS